MSSLLRSLEDLAAPCFNPTQSCPDYLTECFQKQASNCEGSVYSSRYDNASAAYVVYCAILMFFMKAGFLYLEESFSKDEPKYRRRVVLAKYIDIFAGTFGFWLFGYAISANTDASVLGEEQDYIFWFFRFTFASNTATILGGTLVGHKVQMRTTAIFVYSFLMTAFIHPLLARFFWSVDTPDIRPGITWSPYAYCNGTFTTTRSHEFTARNSADLGDIVFIDFAGSGLVHLCGGMGALALAIFHKLELSNTKKLKKVRECGTCCNLLSRDTKQTVVAPQEEQEQAGNAEGKSNIFIRFIEFMYPSGGGEENVESAALGIIILWTTWFAFNAGSTESISGKAIHAAVGRIALVMCLACASAGLTQTFISSMVQIYKRDATTNSNEIANAVLSGLVAVTGCCPFIDPRFAILIGVLTVGIYHLGVFIEFLLGIYDGARVFPVHGMCGLWGVLCVGLFSRGCLISELYEYLCFCVNSRLPETISDRGLLFAYQLAGGLFIAVWSFVLCIIVFLVLWYIPVKFILTCLPWVFSFQDKSNKRGKIEFVGSVLFTHFDEIGDPMYAPDDPKLDNLQKLESKKL